MAKKQPPYKVTSTVPDGYKLPDSFWAMMIHKAIERANQYKIKEKSRNIGKGQESNR